MIGRKQAKAATYRKKVGLYPERQDGARGARCRRKTVKQGKWWRPRHSAQGPKPQAQVQVQATMIFKESHFNVSFSLKKLVNRRPCAWKSKKAVPSSGRSWKLEVNSKLHPFLRLIPNFYCLSDFDAFLKSIWSQPSLFRTWKLVQSQWWEIKS